MPMQYSWFRCFFLFACLCIHQYVFSLPVVSYTEHCSSILPEYNITTLAANNKYLSSLDTSYFTGGDTFLRKKPGWSHFMEQKNLRLQIRPDNYYQTTAAGVYKVEGSLRITTQARGDRNWERGPDSIEFQMNGFWSEKSRKLCMLGSAFFNGSDRHGVLKLKLADEIPTIYTGVSSGSFESTAVSADDPSYFDPIVIFCIPKFPNYYYSLVWKESFSSDAGARKDDSLSLRPHEFCSAIEWGLTNLELQYAEECTSCSPVGISLPYLTLTSIHCQERERKARFVAVFRNYTSYLYDDFDVGSTLIGEVSWDGESKKMIGVACGISNPPHELGIVVENCTVRLSLRFPSILKVSNDAKVVGEIWSSKSVGDSGYFDKIIFDSNDIYGEMGLPEIKYEYTELERVRKLCPLKKAIKKGNVYPNEHSYNMRFDMNIMDGQGLHLSLADARPSWVGNETYKDGVMPPVGAESGTIHISPAKMSYEIGINPFYDVYSFNFSRPIWGMNQNHQEKFTAEGLYDTRNGFLCMVGCRRVNSTFKDCDMVVEFEFPPVNGNKNALIKGIIRSTRATNDALYFNNLIIESATPYDDDGVRSIRRMDFEITVVLISNMLVCIFVALQIFHVKRNHEVPSFISVVMLVILCIEHMIPFMLNFDVVDLGNHDKKTLAVGSGGNLQANEVAVGSGGKLQANEVAVRVITMVTLLLQLRLLQLVWTAKQNDTNGKGSWAGEIKAGFVSLLLYILGWLLRLLINWMRKAYVSPYSSLRRNYSVWDDLRSYAGLILDGFLFPQIILNIFRGSAERALSHTFYVGTSAVRLVPHIYNLYRTHNYPKNDLNATYYYANPAADFNSTAWDIIIPFGIVVLAGVVFLQQQLGGRCVLPSRFRAFQMYEKLPAAADYQ